MASNPEVFRAIKKVWKSEPTLEGAGVHLRRVFGFHEVPQLDPFLLLDHFKSENPSDYLKGFPWHPHRGIETITYVLDGDVEHADSLGNRGVIRPGEVQWMTAGGGIIHQEMPKGDRKGQMWGMQLWANLPARQKLMDPRYREVKQADIPVVKTAEGATVRVICGEVDGVKGPVREIVTDPFVIEGEGWFDPTRDPFVREATGESWWDTQAGRTCDAETLVLYGPGAAVRVLTDKKAVRFILVSGQPLREPVAWYGPIVMNTREELKTAFEDFERGTFARRPRAG
jgi:quercetin 2,3-dioxygenase